MTGQLRPNILFIFPDQWRGDWIGAITDRPVKTPNIDELLNRGVGFAKAWTPSPLCAPARSCLATGKNFEKAPVKDNFSLLPSNTPTFYQHLRDAGYRVASIGKSDLLKPKNSWGKDGQHREGGINGFAQLGFTDGADMAGKHDSIVAIKNGCNDPYTDLLQRNGYVETYLEDLKTRYVSTPVLLQDWEDGKATTPPPAYSNTQPSPLPKHLYMDNVIGEAALDQLDRYNQNEPWFLMVNFAGPHEPLDVTKDMINKLKNTKFPLPQGCKNEDFDLQQRILQRYAAMQEGIDYWIGRMVDNLGKTDTLKNTIVVFASDHGDMLGDKNIWQKQVPYEPSVHVPMILAGPSIISRELVKNKPASLIDLPATFLAWAGGKVLENSDAVDLSDFLKGQSEYPRHDVGSGLGNWRAVTDGRWKLVVGFKTDIKQGDIQKGNFDPQNLDEGMLFDIEIDPFEENNLWHSNVKERERLLILLAQYIQI